MLCVCTIYVCSQYDPDDFRICDSAADSSRGVSAGTGGRASFASLHVCTGEFPVTNLPPLDGTNINWNDYLFLRRESLLLWGIVAVIVVMLLIFLKGRMFENVLMFISGCMTLMLVVTGVSIVVTNPPEKESTQLYVTQKDEFTMSQKENFVILVLDSFDSREFTELLSEHPEYRETFADFTYFDNMTAAYSCTKRSIPFILGGDWYENQGSFTEYMNGVYSGSPLFTALKERGYLIDLYEDDFTHGMKMHFPILIISLLPITM